MNKLKFAIPIGSLQQSTLDMLGCAGFRITLEPRSYRPTLGNDPDIVLKLLRPQEIPKFVEEGFHDVGITGQDWVIESGADVVEVCELDYGRVKMVLAVPQSSNIDKPEDLKNIKSLRVSTEYVNTSRNYLENLGITDSKVNFSYGATEAKPPEEADAIIDITQTGTTLSQNNLDIIDVLLESEAVFVANKESYKDPWKKGKIQDIAMMLMSVVRARNKLLIKLNVPKSNLEKIVKILPAMERPTISPLFEEGETEWYAVETVVDEDDIPKLIPKLKKEGAKDILELDVKKIVP